MVPITVRGTYGHYVSLLSEVSSAAQTDQSMTSAKVYVKPASKSLCLEMLKREVCKHAVTSINIVSYFTKPIYCAWAWVPPRKFLGKNTPVNISSGDNGVATLARGWLPTRQRVGAVTLVTGVAAFASVVAPTLADHLFKSTIFS